MIILIAIISPKSMYNVCTDASEDGPSVKRSASKTSPGSSIEPLEDVPDTEMMDNNQSSVTSSVNREGEKVSGDKLTSNSTDLLLAVMSDMTLKSAEKNN